MPEYSYRKVYEPGYTIQTIQEAQSSIERKRKKRAINSTNMITPQPGPVD